MYLYTSVYAPMCAAYTFSSPPKCHIFAAFNKHMQLSKTHNLRLVKGQEKVSQAHETSKLAGVASAEKDLDF